MAYNIINPKLPYLSAAGKNIVITGGGTGIAASTALCFAQAGASNISIPHQSASALNETKASNIASVSVVGAESIFVCASKAATVR
jgi:NAD(P)-dependent dehydrogenase (short-subunit alcohol dehydrogenase family)